MTSHCVLAQDSLIHRLQFQHYKETALTLGYNYNFDGDKDGVTPPKFHFVELGFWKTNTFTGHHPVMTGYYLASDFGLNDDSFVIGPKIGGFMSIMIIGFGGELCYYTDFSEGSLRFIPSLGFITPFFKLTVNPHVVLTNAEFHNFNKVHINLAVRIWKIKREELN